MTNRYANQEMWVTMPDCKAIIIVALACLPFAGWATSQESGTSGNAIAITHVNVVPMDGERVIPDQTVIVRNGRIASIGPTNATELPEDVSLVIEGRGQYLMPGLADMHAHFFDEEDSLALFVANGVTTVRNMFGAPAHLDWRERVTNGSLLGPNIYTMGPILDGDPPYTPDMSVVRTPKEAAEEVIAQKKAGYDGIKVYENLLPEVYAAILEAASEAQMPVYGHAPVRVGLERALEGGQRSFEHMRNFMWALIPENARFRGTMAEALSDKSKRNVRTYVIEPLRKADPARIPNLVAKMASSSVWFCPTLVHHNKFASTKEEFEELRRRYEMRYIPPPVWAWWDGFEANFVSDLGDPPTVKRAFKTMRYAVKALHDGGARLIVGTDALTPYVVPGFSVHEELNHLVDAGLTPYEAIKAATRDAAEFVDALDEWGTVAVGRRADLILVDANPLEDVANASKQIGVMLRGRWYAKAELQAKLDALAEKYAKMKAEGEATIAIENVNVVPMDREAVLPDQTVMVRDGKIVSVAPASEANVPAFATRIDGTGKYLMPGLADMHVHLLQYGVTDPGVLSLFLANGVTTVRNMMGNPEILEWRRRIEEGDLIGPRIYTTGPILDGEPPYWPGSVAIETREQAEQEVAAEKMAGYDGVKVLAGIPPEAYEAVLAAAGKHDIPVYGHAPARLGLENVVHGGQRSFEHMQDFMYALLPKDSPIRDEVVAAWTNKNQRNLQSMLIRPYTHADGDNIEPLAKRIAASGGWMCPTLITVRGIASSPEEFAVLQRAPSKRYVEPDERERWKRTTNVFSSETGDPAALKRAYRTMLNAVGAMHDAGVRLLVGTDSPSPFVVPGFSVHEELEIFMEAGLTSFEALAAATRDAAEFLTASEAFGTVQVGRRADLILVKGNPLEDVSHTSELAGVMANGTWFSEKELDAMLEKVAEDYRKAAAKAPIPEGKDE
jgi:imidazolonepropionase-like amidohydrolase